jgi:hypothetical protein
MVNYVKITERLFASRKRTSICGARAQLQCEDSFLVWAERASPHSLTVDVRGRQLFAELQWLVTGLLSLLFLFHFRTFAKIFAVVQ